MAVSREQLLFERGQFATDSGVELERHSGSGLGSVPELRISSRLERSGFCLSSSDCHNPGRSRQAPCDVHQHSGAYRSDSVRRFGRVYRSSLSFAL